MKIIDAHLHFFPESEAFTQSAKKAGHEASLTHLSSVMQANGIILGIGMGTVPAREFLQNPRELSFSTQDWPKNFVQCLGINATAITKENQQETMTAFEKALQRPECVGFKVYAGYEHFYVNDALYHPFYEMAEQYDVPVVIHTGDTANAEGLLKYSHPLTVDEAAVNFPRVKFVMAHYGNPWLVDATEVIKKNPNVYADLSGLVEGNFVPEWFLKTYHGYVEQIRTWLTYLSRYDKLMYGSDWPLVNIPSYIGLIRRLIPEEYHTAVFYENAKSLFKKIRV